MPDVTPSRPRSLVPLWPLAGAFTTLAVDRDAGARRWLAVGVALVCGALAVAHEERAQHP